MNYYLMFIQGNEAESIYHLCYTDNTHEVIGYARFRELLPLTSYDADNGVYWFESNRWMFAQAGGTNGTTETDAQFWARQNDLIDYAATVDAASYRGQ